MTKHNRTASSNHTEAVILPLASECADHNEEDRQILARFMRHVRHVPISRMEIKVLSAIQFTADMLDCSDAHIAKVLVDVGLRAPRAAFPAAFLKYADHALMREDWAIGGPNKALKDLKSHWFQTSEDQYESTKSVLNRDQYSLLETV